MKLARRTFAFGLVLALCSGAASIVKSNSDIAPAGKRPTVILVLTDDQGYGPMRCHGDENIVTPELDRLFRESTRFTNFHVQLRTVSEFNRIQMDTVNKNTTIRAFTESIIQTRP